jgi:omega-amidase
MKIKLVQTNIFWRDSLKNKKNVEYLLSTNPTQTALTILPEMFNTGFTMQPNKDAEKFKTETYNWLKTQSKNFNTTFVTSIATKENSNYYNRLHWIEDNDTEYFYDKRHLFRMANEDEFYTVGNSSTIISFKGWKIKPLICYDLRFPAWCRNKFDKKTNQWNYDVLLFVANWPEIRDYHWQHLLIARAIENQCYVVAVNRVGIDGNNIKHCGNSLVINPRGEIISQIPLNTEGCFISELEMNYLLEYRKAFPVGLDADTFELFN